MKNSSISLKKGVRQNNNSNSKTKKKETVVFYSQHKKALAVGKATVLCDGPWVWISPSPPLLLEASGQHLCAATRTRDAEARRQLLVTAAATQLDVSRPRRAEETPNLPAALHQGCS